MDTPMTMEAPMEHRREIPPIELRQANREELAMLRKADRGDAEDMSTVNPLGN